MEKVQQKFELQTLDVNAISELDGWKSKMEDLVKENPFVEIKDRASYEEAKKRRTALRTGRTSYQNQDKAIGSFLSNFRKSIIAVGESIVSIVKSPEELQQAEIDSYEAILEEKRLEKQRIEEARIENINKEIDLFKKEFNEILSGMTFENIDKSSYIFDELIEKKRIDFEEFQVVFENALNESNALFSEKVGVIKTIELERVERLRVDELDRIERVKTEENALLDRLELWAIKRVSEATIEDAEILNNSVISGINKQVESKELSPVSLERFEKIKQSAIEKSSDKIILLREDFKRNEKLLKLEKEEEARQLAEEKKQIELQKIEDEKKIAEEKKRLEKESKAEKARQLKLKKEKQHVKYIVKDSLNNPFLEEVFSEEINYLAKELIKDFDEFKTILIDKINNF